LLFCCSLMMIHSDCRYSFGSPIPHTTTTPPHCSTAVTARATRILRLPPTTCRLYWPSYCTARRTVTRAARHFSLVYARTVLGPVTTFHAGCRMPTRALLACLTVLPPVRIPRRRAFARSRSPVRYFAQRAFAQRACRLPARTAVAAASRRFLLFCCAA